MGEQDWKAGEFSFISHQGDQVRVAAWLHGLWALDFRVWEGPELTLLAGWALTHIPTGKIAAGILDDLPNAQAIAKQVDAFGDWNFTAFEGARAFSDDMRKLRYTAPNVIVFREPMMGPNFYYDRSASPDA